MNIHPKKIRFIHFPMRHRGFTLVEVLVALVILAIGVLAVANLTVMGVRTSTMMNRRMYARDVLNRYHEELMNLPTSDSILRHLTSDSLGDTINHDYEQYEIAGRGEFQIIWNVADSVIDTVYDSRFKTICIHVSWPHSAQPLTSYLIKRY